MYKCSYFFILLFLYFSNGCGQLGIKNIKNLSKLRKVSIKNEIGRVEKIYCGYGHTILLNEENQIYGCGNNDNGELGFGLKTDSNEFTKMKNPFGE